MQVAQVDEHYPSVIELLVKFWKTSAVIQDFLLNA